MSETNGKSFWGTAPGILTGIAAVMTAAGGLILAWPKDAPENSPDSPNAVEASLGGNTVAPPLLETQTYEDQPAPVPIMQQSPVQAPIGQQSVTQGGGADGGDNALSKEDR